MQTKKLLSGLLFFTVILVLLAVFVKPKFDAFMDEPIEPSLMTVDEPVKNVIISSSIMNSPRPNGNDQFWAAMYRQDPITGNIYYVVNKAKQELVEMKGVDVASFTVRTTGDGDKYAFATDINGVYCNEKIQPNIDLNSFYFVNNFSSYVKDAKNVYYSCDPIEGADPTTLMEVGIQTPYAKDARNVYFKGEKLPGADPKTFTLIEAINHTYAMDATHVYKAARLAGQRNFLLGQGLTGKLMKKYALVLFENQNETHVVDSFKVNLHEGSEELVVHRGKIYFTNLQGQVVYFDSVNSSFGTVNLGSLALLDSRQRPAILNYFIHNEDLYMLYGDNCNEYLNRCIARLIRHDMRTNQQETILENQNARDIIGFDEIKGELYITWSDGDAGCGWVSAKKVNIAQKKIVGSGGFSACDGEPDYDQKVEDYKLFRQPIENDIKRADAVYFQDGKIVSPPDEDTGGNVVYLNN